MTEKEYNICCGKILARRSLDEDEAQAFMDTLNEIENLLDNGDQEDFYGTEGWRHYMGWD